MMQANYANGVFAKYDNSSNKKSESEAARFKFVKKKKTFSPNLRN